MTRDRLYIDAWKSVLEQSSKVIVDVGDDNIMILPLDRQGTSVSDDDEMRNAVSAASQGR